MSIKPIAQTINIRRIAVICLLMAALGTLRSQAQSAEAIFDAAKKTDFKSVGMTYKQLNGTGLSLTIYDPAQQSDRKCPAIVFFFGGGWVNGSPRQFEQQARYFATRGLITVLVDYRTESKHHTTPFDAVRDARSAMRYLRKNAERLHIDPDKIAASGGSAGGHLAAACDLTHLDEAGEDTTVNARPNALVLFNPVFDNGPDGYGYERIGERFPEISPMHNIRPHSAPTIIFLGTKDQHIPVATAKTYQQKMIAAGNLCELLLYQDQKHGFFNYRADGDNKYFFLTLSEADRFLSKLGYIAPLAK